MAKNNPQKVWDVIKTLTNNKEPASHSSSKLTADMINSFFAGVGPELASIFLRITLTGIMLSQYILLSSIPLLKILL